MSKSSKGKILVSACLYGHACKYDGTSNILKDPLFQALKNMGRLVPVCPEQLGGLSTPRIPCEIKGDKVFNKEGEDVSAQFHKGAEEALRIARENKVRVAILKQSSPSCGCKNVYDGTFSGKMIPGAGVLTQALQQAGIRVMDSEEV